MALLHLMKHPSPSWPLLTLLYLRIAPEEAGMLTGILSRPNGLTYYVTWGDREETAHFEGELTDERTFEGTTTEGATV